MEYLLEWATDNLGAFAPFVAVIIIASAIFYRFRGQSSNISTNLIGALQTERSSLTKQVADIKVACDRCERRVGLLETRLVKSYGVSNEAIMLLRVHDEKSAIRLKEDLTGVVQGVFDDA